MKDSGLFVNMTPMSWASIIFFVLAKVFGMVGVCLGFLGPEYRTVGGILLGIAIVSIFTPVGCSFVQMSKDKKNFESEDMGVRRVRQLADMRFELEEEIRELESRKSALKNLMFRKG